MSARIAVSATAPGPAVTLDPRWAAVIARDRNADGRFCYSVRTTGVYCRPSCGARRANPENVRFHDTPAEAEQAGFRPCKRCRPDQSNRDDPHTGAVVAACRLIEQAELQPTLAELSEAAGLSRYHFHRVFKVLTGLTPKAYADAHRARRLRGALAEGESVTRAMADAGYGSASRFYAEADGILGMRPATYRARGRTHHIRYGLASCSLGIVLVAASERGICEVALGDDPRKLEDALRTRFAEAAQTCNDPQFAHWLAAVVAAIDGPAGPVDLPLDIRGTVFQQRVWQALREIPEGSTLTYAQLAARVGQAGAARAVAGACAANMLAVLVPCHRVVRSDGAVAGYRWGVARKRALLRKEQDE